MSDSVSNPALDDKPPIQMEQDRNLYSHDPLTSPTHIRLLCLEETAPGNELHAVLIDTEIEQAKELYYTALSYAWGEPLFSHRLYLDRQYLPITARLHAALCEMARETRRVLWVDAICIDQLELHEKAVQIPLMYQIYASSRLVMIWLGEQDKSITRLFEAIPALCAKINEIEDNRELSLDERWALGREILKGSDGRSGWQSLFERKESGLIDCGWYKRLSLLISRPLCVEAA